MLSKEQHSLEELKKQLFEKSITFDTKQIAIIEATRDKQLTAFARHNLKVVGESADDRIKSNRTMIFVDEADRKQKRKAENQTGSLAKKQKVIEIINSGLVEIGKNMCDPKFDLYCYCISKTNGRCGN
jgi:hypothetical protein